MVDTADTVDTALATQVSVDLVSAATRFGVA